MKRLFLLGTAFLLGSSSTQADQTGYERKAFAGRYGLWENVRCLDDSVRLTAESGDSLASPYSMAALEVDARSGLSRLAFPRLCDPQQAPAPATMVSVEIDVRTVTDDEGSIVYYLRLLAAMPDGDFSRTSIGQLTRWESSGTLGRATPDRTEVALRSAMAEQIGEFAEFMGRTRTMHDR